MRLDVYLVEAGYFESRNRALDAIKSGIVTVDGKKVKPSMQFEDCGTIEVANEKFYVSRAGRKLEAFLSEHPISIEGKRVLDIGSSTGGFAQILLESKANAITCVDVGSDQLHHTLRDNEKITILEQTDIRNFRDEKGFELITCDVSFISLLDILDSINNLAKNDIVLLYKPQFEVGKDVKRDSRGVVTDIDAIVYAKKNFEEKCSELGWRKIIDTNSKIQGKEGNTEYFYHFAKGEV